MYRLLNFVTCSKIPKFGSNRREDPYVSIPTPLVDEDRQDGNRSVSLNDVEMFGYSKMGSGPGKTECQDTYALLSQLTPNLHSFGVYDGHGIKGKEVSVFVNQHMTTCLKKNAANIEKLVTKDYVESFFKTTFKIIENKLNHTSINTTHSGTCCLTVIVSNGRCFVANLGDSRAVLCRQTADGKHVAVELSQDHKPTREDEKQRILSVGGRVEPVYYDGTAIGPLRVWTKTKQGGIAVTRAMGDTRGRKAGLISEPEVLKFDLEADDKFIVAGSDGLWDVFSSQEAVSFVAEYIARGRPKSHAARALVREASKRWENMEGNEDDPYRDDITVVVAFLGLNHRDTMIETPSKTPISREIRD